MSVEVIVVTGGDPTVPGLLDRLPRDATVIAADSGLGVAMRLGLRVDLVVGDLDSVDPVALAAVERAGVPVERHPVAKDRTDLAIAVDAAARLAPGRIVVVGGDGGRLDHFLGNALLLASPEYAGQEIEAHMGHARVQVVRDSADLEGSPGTIVSLLPAHGRARGVRTTGLAYPLIDEDLPPGSTRGISNEMTGSRAHVTVEDGTVLAVSPGSLDPGATRPRSEGEPR